ncbi:pyridoxal phosphate-dependent transferase [Microdochium trichocladiopsis]|uniref:Pyridoxal phosphate-dependent transferase n=1 Tax=Microdochium trichocladiopsis TaxID=1682393 RepID=A0A9P9BQ14_9PEZI|nr:pyridoxal phosphate-dependent transferase [Microdochium trichocladiopsis]KAH7025076.1 pyridoxal phosphate-dependent transferase [Microdochium trichocladiopsis]
MWAILLSRLKATTAVIKKRYDERARIEKEISARTDDWCIDVFLQLYTRIQTLTTELEMQLAITQTQNVSIQGQQQQSPEAGTNSPLASYALAPWQMEERYRALIQLQSCLGSFFERASPAYDQSKTVWWFDPSYHLSDGLNYDRYGAPDVRAFEAQLLEALALGSKACPTKLLLTSSGVAAFTVLHQFLMSTVLTAGDTIVISPYLYFECFEHLRLISHIRVVNSPTFAAEDIIATAEAHNAKAVYLDPMANTLGLDTTDIRKMAQLLSSRGDAATNGWADRYLLIDGTLISGGMPVYDWFGQPGTHHPKVLYYESAHKYIQMGMDVVMCGLLVYPAEHHETIGLIRQVTGTTLYSRQANVLPPIDLPIHQSRMGWLTANAERLYHLLDQKCGTIAKINFPTHWRGMGWGHGGNVVTIRLYGDESINKRPSLDAFTALILRAGEEEGVALTKGGGLGFSVTRVWPSTPFIRNEDPYMRISVGIDPAEVEPTARAIEKALDRHYRASRSAMAQWRLRENGGVAVVQNNGAGAGVIGGNKENGVVKAGSAYFVS